MYMNYGWLDGHRHRLPSTPPFSRAAGWTAIDTTFHRHRLLAAAGRAVHRTDYCDDAVYEIDGFTLAGPPSVDGGLFANGGLNGTSCLAGRQ
jgi:hypothetical protein